MVSVRQFPRTITNYNGGYSKGVVFFFPNDLLEIRKNLVNQLTSEGYLPRKYSDYSNPNKSEAIDAVASDPATTGKIDAVAYYKGTVDFRQEPILFDYGGWQLSEEEKILNIVVRDACGSNKDLFQRVKREISKYNDYLTGYYVRKGEKGTRFFTLIPEILTPL